MTLNISSLYYYKSINVLVSLAINIDYRFKIILCFHYNLKYV